MVSAGEQPSRLTKLVMLPFLSRRISAFLLPVSARPLRMRMELFMLSLSVAFPGAGSPFVPDTKALLGAAGS